MTSTTMRPAGTGGQHVQGRGLGLVAAFASVAVPAVVGIFNLIYGIAAVANAHVFVAGANTTSGVTCASGAGSR